ncbi:MAG TPA: choice-of-anchor Q domain-containing protein [Dokdonella sp.]
MNAMSLPIPARPRRAPLFAALAFALGSVAAHAAEADPGAGLARRLAEHQAALRDQLAARARPPHAAPARPAARLVVANCDDAGPGSLRDAFAQAVNGDVVDLTQLACSTITLSGGALRSEAPYLTLEGPGADRLAIDGGRADRIVDHDAGSGTLTIEGLTLRNGSYTYAGPGLYASAAPGGCVLSDGSVTIVGSALEQCSAYGASVFGGAIHAQGALTLTGSTISGTTAVAAASDLSATSYGGVVYAGAVYLTDSAIRDATITVTTTSAFASAFGGGAFGSYGVELVGSTISGVHAQVTAAKDAYAKGGGVASPATVVLSASTIADNSVQGTPGAGPSGAYVYTSAIGGGGVYVASVPRGMPAPSSITNSTISGNAALVAGAAGDYTLGGGGGIATWSPLPLTIANSTVSGNVADRIGGGVYTRHRGALALANATITDNAATDGAGVADVSEESAYALSARSSLVAGNHGADDGAVDVLAARGIVGTHDLIASADAALPPDTSSADPRLGPLADNGGPTRTHALQPGSPAIDAGSNDAGFDTDQRGAGYARIVGAAADIGAYEAQAPADGIFADGFD